MTFEKFYDIIEKESKEAVNKAPGLPLATIKLKGFNNFAIRLISDISKNEKFVYLSIYIIPREDTKFKEIRFAIETVKRLFLRKTEDVFIETHRSIYNEENQKRFITKLFNNL